jgi:hypothetical protein
VNQDLRTFGKTLIALPALANLDELAAAFGLSRMLSRQGVENIIYAGKYTFPKRLGELFDLTGLKFYQPKYYQNELLISVRLAELRGVRNIRWEQDADNVDIHLEVAPDEEGKPAQAPLEISEQKIFKQVIVMGNTDLGQLEAADHFKRHTNLSQTKVSSWEEFLDSDLTYSYSEQIANFAVKNRYKFRDLHLQELLRGAHYHRLERRMLGQPLTGQLSKVTTLHGELLAAINRQEYTKVLGFWERGGRAKSDSEVEELLALVRITPQLWPINLVDRGEPSLTRRLRGRELSLIARTNLNQLERVGGIVERKLGKLILLLAPENKPEIGEWLNLPQVDEPKPRENRAPKAIKQPAKKQPRQVASTPRPAAQATTTQTSTSVTSVPKPAEQVESAVDPDYVPLRPATE